MKNYSVRDIVASAQVYRRRHTHAYVRSCEIIPKYRAESECFRFDIFYSFIARCVVAAGNLEILLVYRRLVCIARRIFYYRTYGYVDVRIQGVREVLAHTRKCLRTSIFKMKNQVPYHKWNKLHFHT